MIKVKKCRSVEERSGLEMRCLMDNETKRAESLFLAGEFAESLSLFERAWRRTRQMAGISTCSGSSISMRWKYAGMETVSWSWWTADGEQVMCSPDSSSSTGTEKETRRK